MRSKKITLDCIAALLVLLFLYTALSKFLDFEGFTYDINNQPFPDRWTPILIWLIPGLEIAITINLLVPKWRFIGLWASLVVMTMFTAYTAMVLMHGFSYIPCSCGGVVKNLTWPQHLVLNLSYVAISILGIFLYHPTKQKQSITA